MYLSQLVTSIKRKNYINIKLKDDKGGYSYTFSTSATGFWTKLFPVNRKTTISNIQFNRWLIEYGEYITGIKPKDSDRDMNGKFIVLKTKKDIKIEKDDDRGLPF